jgi:hypothetical protein
MHPAPLGVRPPSLPGLLYAFWRKAVFARGADAVEYAEAVHPPCEAFAELPY